MQRAAPQRQLRAPRPWERRRHARDFMTAGAADEPLYGREHELQVVAGLVGGLATGTGGALAIRGEAGIGKSALLAAAAGLAADSNARVLSATGIQAEARLPFAALHQLLRPVLPLAEQLPPRQRAALLSAFGIADAEPAEPFLIGLATLEVISDAAPTSPVLLIADTEATLRSECSDFEFSRTGPWLRHHPSGTTPPGPAGTVR